MRAILGAFAIPILFMAMIPAVMAANTAYWTASSSFVPYGFQKYHLYLYGSYPSSTNEAIKIVNEHLKVCLDFSPNEKPYICHRIPASQIPPANDSIIDAGFFVVPSSLNASNAGACVSVDYHNMYSCGGTAGSFNHEVYSLFYGNMNYLIYDDAFAVHACIEDHHLKEGTKDFNFCMKMLT